MPAPAKKLRPRVKGKIAQRVCDYLNETYSGNVTRAAVALDCSYDGLLRMAYGTAVKPVVPVIQALALKSGQSIDWWLAE